MRFLVDTNLPRTLVPWIESKGHDCAHVLDLSLGQAEDLDIWRRAALDGATIISKDEDFADLARRTQTGPSVVWVRTGNGTTRQLLDYLGRLWPTVEAKLSASERLVELR